MKKNTKNTKTFAQRARELKKKYSRAEWDKMEREELAQALRELRDEQEMMRAEMGLGDNMAAPVEGMGEVQQFDGFNRSQFLNNTIQFPETNLSLPEYNFSPIPSVNSLMPNNRPLPQTVGRPIAAPTAMRIPEQFTDAKFSPNLETTLMEPADTATSPKFGSLSSSLLPVGISALATGLGSKAGAARMKKLADKTRLPRMSAQEINLEAQRESIRRRGDTATNIALRAGRDVGSGGERYANQIAGVSTINDSVGEGLAQSYMNEANTNAQFRQDAAGRNLQMGAMEAQLRDRYNMAGSQYMDNLSTVVPQALADARAIRGQDMMMSTVGKDYGLYQEIPGEEDWKQRLRRQLLGSPYSIRSREGVLNQR